ncbi:GNAT family N-acetyltransferase [Aureimonas sp. Leaf454]|uniref:GNAT family N-acetyltransferase n=1 Tax=Aureimonas sp. Leaf454 TaxID=1736381 RepID=UPI001FCDB6B3|nr:GNAT family N-acetyltransferase [Aureimonas sp. Leaf454]
MTDDVANLVRLVNSAYRGETATRGWTHEAALLKGQRIDADMLLDMLGDPRHTLLAGEDGEGLAGCVDVVAESGFGYLGLLTVAPDRQSRTYGKALLAAGEAVARDLGLRRIRMTVISQRFELIAWYERRGYARTGARAPFPLDDPRFGVPLQDDLDFVVLEKPLPA